MLEEDVIKNGTFITRDMLYLVVSYYASHLHHQCNIPNFSIYCVIYLKIILKKS